MAIKKSAPAKAAPAVKPAAKKVAAAKAPAPAAKPAAKKAAPAPKAAVVAKPAAKKVAAAKAPAPAAKPAAKPVAPAPKAAVVAKPAAKKVAVAAKAPAPAAKPEAKKSVAAKAPVAAKAVKVAVVFEKFSPDSNSVEVVGTFNGWQLGKTPLRKDKDGVWSAKVTLEPGTYEYKFVFDGLSYEADPEREQVWGPFGANNLLVVV